MNISKKTGNFHQLGQNIRLHFRNIPLTPVKVTFYHGKEQNYIPVA